MGDRKNWASLDRDKIGERIFEKVGDYYEYLSTSGRYKLWQRSYEYYYRGFFRMGELIRAGEQEEYTTMHVNDYHNLLRHLFVMTTSQPPSFEPRASNTDYKSQAQTIVGANVLDYYRRDKRMGAKTDSATENSLVFGESEISAEWDPNSGEDYGVKPDQSGTIKTGDIVFTVREPIDVIRDVLLTSSEDTTWKVLRDFVNKWDLAAQYPAFADKIIDLSMSEKDWKYRTFSYTNYKDTDLIPRYKFYHAPTPSMPKGRVVELVASDVVLVDTANPYGEIPSYRIAGEEQKGTPFGYTLGYDLLPIQEALDGLYSTVITNQSSFGVQNIALPNGAKISNEQLMKGLNIFRYDPKLGKPEALNLVNTPPEIFKFIEMLHQIGETLSGVNSVARGNPEASLKSGAALALVQSMAIQFASGLQKGYAGLIENTGTAVINILKRFPQTKRMMAVAGKSNRSYMKSFTKDDLTNINRVMVDMGNPLARTTAGKVEMADTLMERGRVTNEQYIQVLTTGKLEPIYEGQQAELMNIRAENEKLQAGEMVQALATDNPKLHINEHLVVLASPESRQDPKIVENALAHIQEHIEMWKTASPALLSIWGIDPLPPDPGMMGGMGGGLPADPNSPPPPQATPGGAAMPPIDPTQPVQQKADSVNMPSMPTNPLTGNKFNPATGGL